MTLTNENIKILKEFKIRANPRADKNIRLNKAALGIFANLCRRNKDQIDYDFNYFIADEIVANRRAIVSLDNRVCRLKKDIDQLINKQAYINKIIMEK